MIRRKEKYLLRRRTNGERWSGMWDFVRFEIDDALLDQLPFAALKNRKGRAKASERSLFTSSSSMLPATIRHRVQEQIGATVGEVVAGTEFTYSVTRYRVRLLGFLCEGTASKSATVDKGQWFTREEIAELPLSKTGRQVADWLASR